ncbi:hypothetical protein K458DRAFT_445662 [Lentithecium fluviatile CBS 122367]|uniref:Prolyl 4-hydroxylase alpha subunit Fe(2+) 2OG dioxygenase domain-containing protein n=1 Tax=Lentithecium fluviatile CBS 122367 TaxID=1168545 RepID=A0A6G1IPB0_9PLEO|nr:hypothetical protein K458DRAFT_445662 [Lentithecium fluviatile CBS 122367]
MESETPSNNNLCDAITRELGSFIQRKSSLLCVEAQSQYTASSPIVLRWDSPESPPGVFKLAFPVDTTIEESRVALEKLIAACQPASFGYKGEDVLDESYPKATKMDRSSFFMLLPTAGGCAGTRGFKAKLYKLNIYGAPSGFFRAHVNIPSFRDSIWVPGYLPPMLLRSSGAGENPNASFQWATFYSDCEHEMLEVTQGHRITLTYDLYYAYSVGDLASNSPALVVSSLLLYKKIEEVLVEPMFMPDGDGYLGVFCQHAYVHSTAEGIEFLPSIMKGSAMAVYFLFLALALGLNISIRPVLQTTEEYLGEEYDAETEDYIDLSVKYEGQDFIAPKWMRANLLTKPMHKNMGMVHLTYGNQAGIGDIYSHAALVVSILPAYKHSKRG